MIESESQKSSGQARPVCGAVTDGYQADRGGVLRMLDEALATAIVCMLRYKCHSHRVRGSRARPVAAEFLEHARDEERHVERIAERIVQLGGEPNYSPEGILARSQCAYVEGRSLSQMVRQNLLAERIVIDSYRSRAEQVATKDPTTRRVFEEMLASAEGHASQLADLLVDLGPGGFPASDAAGAIEADATEADRAPDVQRAADEFDDEDEVEDEDGEAVDDEDEDIDELPDLPSPDERARTSDLEVLGRESGSLPRDLGYGASHGYAVGRGGPSSPGDAPAPQERRQRPD